MASIKLLFLSIYDRWLGISVETRDAIMSHTVIFIVSFIGTLTLSYIFNNAALAAFIVISAAICYQVTQNLTLGDYWYSFDSAVYRMRFIICLLGILAGVLL